MAERRIPREARRRVWLDRIEWIAFCGCVIVGIVVMVLFSFPPA
jgi:hypothetical protein